MSEVEQKRRPWEIPPDESYWRALLEEDEYIQSPVFLPAKDTEPHSPPDIETLSFQDRVQDLSLADEPISPAWALAQEHMRSGHSLELTITGYNRGGLLVEWNELTGFVPASQICAELPHGDEDSRIKALAARVGETLTLEVIECEPERNRLILSEQGARLRLTPDQDLLVSICPGDVCRGQVTNLCSFGAFVDLGGVEGLIHISELSWGRVAHPEEVLQNGQEIEVYVLGVNPQQGRIALSLKRLQPDPWHTVEERYEVGQWVGGTVTSVVSFGAFVRLEEGLEGLVHISKFRDNHGQATHDLVENQSVQVCILNIDSAQHRIGLSLE
ncbi:MAG: S1 RNA-binding domain-containing protein [Anaerolineae bacterium]|nr:S1 RNA-binding domain-containing protein [Anaerolineae bacterium]